MIARRFSAPLSRATKRAISSRLVASSWIEISVWLPDNLSSSHGCTELSHCPSSPSAARLGRRRRCFARLRRRSHSPASNIHRLSVSALTTTPKRLSRCSASSVGPKSAYSGSAAADSATSRTSADSARFDRRPLSPCTAAASPTASNLRSRRRRWRVVTPSRTAPADPDSTPSLTCLSTEMRSLSLRLNSIDPSPGPCSTHSNRTWTVRGHFYCAKGGHFYCATTPRCPGNLNAPRRVLRMDPARRPTLCPERAVARRSSSGPVAQPG